MTSAIVDSLVYRARRRAKWLSERGWQSETTGTRGWQSETTGTTPELLHELADRIVLLEGIIVDLATARRVDAATERTIDELVDDETLAIITALVNRRGST
jgi:hypothetical protein